MTAQFSQQLAGDVRRRRLACAAQQRAARSARRLRRAERAERHVVRRTVRLRAA